MSLFEKLEQQLSDFDVQQREAALRALAARLGLPSGEPSLNLHGHSFYSHNGQGWSPQRILWEAKKKGLSYFGIVEFDVLDSMRESFRAGKMLDLPVVVGLETRVFAPEMADVVVNSPGEPGISYAMGMGFSKLPKGKQEQFLGELFIRAKTRNIEVMRKVNDCLGDYAAINYEDDVVTLTPSGNATERHMVVAYANKAASNIHGHALTAYWTDKLGLDFDEVGDLIKDDVAFHGMLRKKLMKQGGVGYITPNSESFPNISTFFEWVKASGAVPTATWLDGMSDGEQDPDKLLGIYQECGAVALNIIPHRNYKAGSIDPNDKKFQNLKAIIAAAQRREMPLVMGTELNAPGLPFVDNWNGPHLAPYRDLALEGARYMHEHAKR